MAGDGEAQPRPRNRSPLTWALCVCAVLTAYVAALVTTGSQLPVVLQFLLTAVLGVLLPGLVIVRVLRRASAPLLLDLGWAAPAGLSFTLLLWLTARLTGHAVPSALAGGVLLLLALLIPPMRRRVLATGGPVDGGGVALVLSVAGCLLAVIGWMRATALVVYPPWPRSDLPDFYQDLYYQVALTGELRRSLRPTYPMVAGEPLDYHWFFHAVAAQLDGTGAHDVDLVVRMLPTFLVLLVVLTAASVGGLLVRHRAGAAGAAAAVAVGGPATGTMWTRGISPAYPYAPFSGASDPLHLQWQVSPTTTQGWVFGIALTGLLVAWIRRRAHDHRAPVVLIPLFALGAAGSKSSQNFDVLAGLGLVVLALLLNTLHDRARRPALARAVVASVVVAAVSLLAAAVLYPNSYGMRFAPGEYPVVLARGLVPAATGAPTLAVLGGAVLGYALVLTQLPGLLFLWQRHRTDVGAWIATGGVVLGALTSILFVHPGGSQRYFMLSALPIFTTVSGAGVAAAVAGLVGTPGRDRRAPRRRAVLAVGGVALAALTLGAGVITWSGARSPLQRWHTEFGRLPTLAQVGLDEQVGEWVLPLVVTLAGATAVALVGARVVRGAVLRLIALAWLCAGAAGPLGVASGTWVAYDQSQLHALTEYTLRGAVPASEALYRAGSLVHRQAAPTDVVATNRVYRLRGPAGQVLDNRDFTVSALTGLRTDVSGYGYAGRLVGRPTLPGRALKVQPFWDPARLDAERALMTAPTTQRLDAAYARGVRWVVADLRSGPVQAQELGRLTQPVFAQDGVYVFRLRAPAGG